MIQRFVNIIFKHRSLSILICLLPVLLSLSGLNHIQTNYHMRYWLAPSDVLIKKLNYFEDHFGNDESAVIAVHNKNGVLDELTLNKISTMVTEIEAVSDVKSTISLVNLDIPTFDTETSTLVATKVVDFDNYIKSQIIKKIGQSSYVPGLFINSEQTILTIFATLKPTIINNGEVFEEIDYRTLTTSLRSIIKKYESDEIDIHLSGTPIIQNDFTEVSEKDLMLIMPALLLFMAIILFVLFRSVWVTISAFIIINITNTFLYSLAGHFDFKFENMLSIVPLVVLTICLADIIHLYMLYQKLRLAGTDKIDALKESIQKNFVPTFLTSFTTAIGFASLYTSKLVPVQNMGVLAAIGMMVAWFLSLTLFPILVSFQKNESFKTFGVINKLNLLDRTAFVKKYNVTILVVFATLSLVLGYIGSQNQVNTDPVKFFKKNTEIRKSSDFILKEFGAVSGPELIIHSGYREGILDAKFLNKVDEFSEWLMKMESISKTISIVSLGKELYRTMNNGDEAYYRIPDSKDEIIDLYFENEDKLKNMLNLSSRISTDMESMRLSILWSITDLRERLYRLELIKKKAKEIGLNVVVTGKNALYLELNDYVVGTFFYSIGIAIITIALIMLFLFRSFKFAFIAMLPNLVPLSFITGVMVIFDIHIDMGTALVCSVCLGIALDDTIHYLIQYYRERKVNSVEISLKNVMNKAGQALFMTSFILVIGFGMFTLSDFIPNIKFGFLCSLTIAIALLTDFFLLPAILLKLDKKGIK